MKMELSGKHAIVCGSTQGIGLAAAMLMADRGAKITLVARNEEKLIDVKGGLSINDGQSHDYLVADFTKPDELKATLDNYLAEGNNPHILINNTGGPKGGPIIDAKISEFEEAFRQHLICNHILVQTIYPKMKENGYGLSLIHI